MTSEESRNGKIVTFYSYKGGTGRTMALANVGWLLASNGKRVLLIDWDLEAPGLHRYFHPFLSPELRDMEASPGVIDFFIEFAAAARLQHQTPQPESTTLKWYERSAALLRFAVPIEWDFPNDGALDIVPAGRQDAAYALRVASFDWQKFYDVLGGGLFLEAVKSRLREDYDFVLIDSRTGMSDTAGICTVHMPDELVVLFTLNQQSIRGAYAIADSAEQQRILPNRQSSLTIWPVPTRLDITAEKKRTDAARDAAHTTFQRFVARLRSGKASYWNAVEVLHQAYYAYEEVLATFGDKPGVTNSMLNKMEALATYISGTPVTAQRLPETERLGVVAKFEREAAPGASTVAAKPMVYISYSSYPPVAKVAKQIADMLTARGIDFFWDKKLRLGDVWETVMKEQLELASVVLALVGKAPPRLSMVEIELAVKSGKRIVPVAIGTPFPDYLAQYQGVQMSEKPLKKDITNLMNGLEALLGGSTPPAVIDPEDPNKGRFGGLAQRNGRVLSATVAEVSRGWFEVTLKVTGDTTQPLEGRVEFHLHEPTFAQPVVSVPVVDGVATTTFGAWGAFTVGAVADDGKTLLELDLSKDLSLPEKFRIE